MNCMDKFIREFNHYFRFGLELGAVLVLMAILVDPAHCQDIAPDKPKAERHLERITWDIKTKVLTAVVSDGRMVPTKEDSTKKAYQPETITDYQIDLSQAHITVNGEREEFGHYEAELMWRVVDLIAQYAGESVLFYDEVHEPEKKPKQEAKKR